MNSISQPLKNEILKLLFASIWQSKEVSITYQGFLTLVRSFAQRFHTERAALTVLLGDTEKVLQPIIKELTDEGQFAVRENARGETIMIEYRGFYLTATNHWYKRLDKDFETPFANTQVLKFVIPNDIHVKVPIDELHERYGELLGYENLIVLEFPSSLSEVIITAEILRNKLSEICLKKIERYLNQQRLLSEIDEKANLEQDEMLSVKNLLASITESPSDEVHRIESGNENSYKLWTVINAILQEEFESPSASSTAEYYYQSMRILYEIVLVYRSIRADSELQTKKEECVFAALSTEPYLFTFAGVKSAYVQVMDDIAPRIALSDAELEQLLQAFIAKTTESNYPGITMFDGLNGNIYYALTPYLAEVYESQLGSMRTTFRQYYHTCYANWLKNRTTYPFIDNERKLEYDLENRLRDTYPQLYALLHFEAVSNCIKEAQQYLPSFSRSPLEQTLLSCIDLEAHTLQPYSVICAVDQKVMLDSARRTVPIWAVIPVINTIIRFFINLLKQIEKIPKANIINKPKTAKKLQDEAQPSVSQHQAQKTLKQPDESPVHESEREPSDQNQETKRSIIKELRDFAGSDSDAQAQLQVLLQRWNPIAGEPGRSNLTKDVNTLCRDSVRSISRGRRNYLPNLERILVLAERISENNVFNTITQKESLKNYLNLYLTLHVLEQQRR